MKRTMQQARLKIPGRTPVPSSSGDGHIPCAWDDCWHDGYDEIKVIVNEPQKKLHYIFCSERHKRLHVNSHNEYGKLGA